MPENAAKIADSVAPAGDSLLRPEDAAPYQVVNPDSDVPVLFLCDHASRAIPAGLDDLGLDETLLCRHIAWDIGAADLARLLAERFDATLVTSGFSRLVIDPNRGLDDPTSIPIISDGVIVPGNRDVAAAAAAARARDCFQPYHAAINRVIDEFLDRGITPAVISIHSFTPVFKGAERPWHFGVLWNKDGRIARPLLDILATDPTIVVGDNEPYSGRGHYGYSVETHAEARGLPHVLLETRQDLVDTHRGAVTWADRLGDALEQCFDRDPGIFLPANH